MIVHRENQKHEELFTCPVEIAAGLLVCQKEQLFHEPARVFRLLGPQVWSVFSAFSNLEIEEAIKEAREKVTYNIVIRVPADGEVPSDEAERQLVGKIAKGRPW